MAKVGVMLNMPSTITEWPFSIYIRFFFFSFKESLVWEACHSTQAPPPAHLLLNFWGCFSRMVWKRWAMEASCPHTNTDSQRDVRTAHVRPIGCRRKARGSHAPATHHSDGEVVVDDLVRNGVPSLLGVVGNHLDAPAVHEHLGAAFHLLQDPPQIHPVIPCRGAQGTSHASRDGRRSRTRGTGHAEREQRDGPGPYLRPIAGSAPGRFPYPGAGRPPGGAPGAGSCLTEKGCVYYK